MTKRDSPFSSFSANRERPAAARLRRAFVPWCLPSFSCLFGPVRPWREGFGREARALGEDSLPDRGRVLPKNLSPVLCFRKTRKNYLRFCSEKQKNKGVMKGFHAMRGGDLNTLPSIYR